MVIKLIIGVVVFLAILGVAVWVQRRLKSPEDRLKDAEIARQKEARAAWEFVVAEKNEKERKELNDEADKVRAIPDEAERLRAAIELLQRVRPVDKGSAGARPGGAL